ncbi:hypothetical protein LSH36_151g05023 [Paralvinella palmiformis]|uniref:Uncharacterized protein n=1 Tax=Paralvinella palmiformis TaxID=53620 RepID=A0AAD9N7C9_9ANNE|nr:hypothetical protein LSH36_151g05023 [Paralvinella palmiformis]
MDMQDSSTNGVPVISGVFRYGKRGPGVFRYGKRYDVDDDDTAAKRIFRWGKRDDVSMDEAAKRIFRWGKRSYQDDVNGYDDDEDDEVKRMIFRYGKRGDVADKRRLFSFGKRYTGNHVASDLDIRSDSPHVPFRFGEK